MSILTRGLSADNKVNIIIGVLTIVIGILSAILAWATWRLTWDRRLRHRLHGHGHESMLLSLCLANLSLSYMALEFYPHTFMSDLLCFEVSLVHSVTPHKLCTSLAARETLKHQTNPSRLSLLCVKTLPNLRSFGHLAWLRLISVS